jgi:HK97 gp10 family phage protein
VELKSLGDLALHLVSTEAGMLKHLHEGLEKCAVRIEKTAKEEIGHYQSAVGPFVAWDRLADSTEEHKAKMGYPADAPLEASGEMRDSITHESHGLEAIIGSTDEKMAYHEFGTPKMPARPVMGPAVFRNKEYIRRLIGEAAISGLVGGSRIHASLGYDTTTGE